VRQDADVAKLKMSTHAGTNLDLPAHSLHSRATSESVDLEVLVGPALVVDVSVVEGEIRVGTPRDEPFPPSYVALSTAADEWLTRSVVRLVRVDLLSV
jgi:hypothetical protein